jgi:TolB-like protein/DNA-binding winged helix-turn-helix (wHTH) protein
MRLGLIKMFPRSGQEADHLRRSSPSNGNNGHSMETELSLAVQEALSAGPQPEEMEVQTADPPQQYRFGTFDIDLAEGELLRQGVRIKLNEKPFQVLCVLLERAGRLVTREDLRQRLWTADTFVDFDANLNTALSTLRHTLGDSAENPSFIETVPRQGYRFITPVIATTKDGRENGNVLSLPAPETMPAVPNPLSEDERTGKDKSTLFGTVLVAVIVFLFLIVGAGWVSYAHWIRRPAAVRKLTILVTPFENLSGDPAQEYLGDGLTDEMITRLGQLAPSRLNVMARSTSMRYKHAQKSLDQIARECQADYILEGSMRRQGDRVRITVQLFKANEQGSLWTEAYDRDARDILIIQEDVADRIVHSLSLELPLAAQLEQ